MKRVYPDKDYCIGCHLCELACITAHSKSKDLIVAYREERSKMVCLLVKKSLKKAIPALLSAAVTVMNPHV